MHQPFIVTQSSLISYLMRKVWVRIGAYQSLKIKRNRRSLKESQFVDIFLPLSTLFFPFYLKKRGRCNLFLQSKKRSLTTSMGRSSSISCRQLLLSLLLNASSLKRCSYTFLHSFDFLLCKLSLLTTIQLLIYYQGGFIFCYMVKAEYIATMFFFLVTSFVSLE